MREKYLPARIVVFGSLVHPEIFHLHSNIAIAVDGIPWLAYLRAWNDVEERFPELAESMPSASPPSQPIIKKLNHPCPKQPIAVSLKRMGLTRIGVALHRLAQRAQLLT